MVDGDVAITQAVAASKPCALLHITDVPVTQMEPLGTKKGVVK
jgi:hypothetical protein